MNTFSRRQFLEEVIATQMTHGQQKSITDDKAFRQYANKTLPARKSTSTLNEYTGAWTETQVRHLLRRTMFGVKDDDVNTLLGMSMSDAIDYLLNNIPANPLPPLNNYTAAGDVDITGVPAGETWVNAAIGNGTLNDLRRYSYKAWWYNVIINQNLSILEKMVFFWHNHFATQTYVVGYAVFSYNHNVMLRANALGNFKQLTLLVTKDPAMLVYLGGNVNTKNNPDENYGRELQELFTLGKFNTPNYTEDDVKAASRVLTGWRVNLLSYNSFFQPQEHDISDKQFSSFYNNMVISGQSGSAGATETDQLIDMIFAKNEVAHYLCTRLYRFFVYYNIDAAIDASIIQPLAQIFVANNYEIKPVLQALLKSEHFFAANNMGCYIKTPLDFLAGAFRTFDITLPPSLNVSEQYAIWNYLVDYGAQTGLDLGDPPNVAGWEPFYESPAFYEIWINSSTFPLRMEFTDMLSGAGFSAGTSANVVIDILGFIKKNNNAADPDLLVDYLATVLLGVSISDSEHDNLKSILLSGQANNTYWTEAWSNYLANPDDANTNIVYSRLSALLTTMLRLPEHQLC